MAKEAAVAARLHAMKSNARLDPRVRSLAIPSSLLTCSVDIFPALYQTTGLFRLGPVLADRLARNKILSALTKAFEKAEAWEALNDGLLFEQAHVALEIPSLDDLIGFFHPSDARRRLRSAKVRR